MVCESRNHERRPITTDNLTVKQQFPQETNCILLDKVDNANQPHQRYPSTNMRR